MTIIPNEIIDRPSASETTSKYFKTKSATISAIATGDDKLLNSEPSSQPHADTSYNEVTVTPGGHVIEVDSTPGAERLAIGHVAGHFIEISENGKVCKVFGNDFEIVLNDKNLVVGGKLNITVNGDANFLIKGNANTKVDGDYNLNVNGNMNTYVSGNKKTFTKGNVSCETTGNMSTYVSKGTYSLYSKGNMSVETAGNMTTFVSTGKYSIFSKGNLSLETKANLITYISQGNYELYASGAIQMQTSALTMLSSSFGLESGTVGIQSSGTLNLTSAGVMTFNGAGILSTTITLGGSAINLGLGSLGLSSLGLATLGLKTLGLKFGLSVPTSLIEPSALDQFCNRTGVPAALSIKNDPATTYPVNRVPVV